MVRASATTGWKTWSRNSSERLESTRRCGLESTKYTGTSRRLELSQEQAPSLLNLTGDLFPAGATTAAQLSEVRRLLLAALLGGETAADIGLREFAGEPAGGAEEEIAALGDATPAPSPNRIVHRTTALAAIDRAAGGHSWAWGQSPGQT